MRKHSYKEYRTNVTKLQAGHFTLSYQKKEREPIHLNSKQAQSKTPYNFMKTFEKQTSHSNIHTRSFSFVPLL